MFIPTRSFRSILLISIIELRGDKDEESSREELSPFCYDPLNDGEIRVLSFKNQDATSKAVQLSMRIVSRKKPVNEDGEPLGMPWGVFASISIYSYSSITSLTREFKNQFISRYLTLGARVFAINSLS